MLDPVRFIANLSTGEMGYAVAREARRRGYPVTLISGPTALIPPQGVQLVPVVTVHDLDLALQKHFPKTDVLVMAAAVGDFIPVARSPKKIPRKKKWRITFRQSPDLIRKFAAQKAGRLVIGFSLETQNWLKRSAKKRTRKNLDGIVANYYSTKHNPFGQNRVHAALIDDTKTQVLRFNSKREFARKLIDWIGRLAFERSTKL